MTDTARSIRIAQNLEGGAFIVKPTERLSKKEVLELVGDPGAVEKELRRFRKSANALSSSHPSLIGEYPQRWVAIHNGEVRAKSKYLTALMEDVRKKQLPLGEIVVRFIDREPQTLIL